MANVSQIRTYIRDSIAALDGFANVYDYERYATDSGKFLALFTDASNPDSKRIVGWILYRESTRTVDLNNSEVRELHLWRIRGFLGLKDQPDGDATPTGKLIDEYVEAMSRAFLLDRTLGGLVDDIKNLDQDEGPVGIQVDNIEPVMFCGVLCHRANLSLITDGTHSSV